MQAKTLKKTLISILTASLLVLAVLIPTFAVTDAERELEAANARVIACEQALNDAKTAYTEAQQNNARGTYGFFQANGSTNAMTVLDNAKYKNLIAYGTAGDATSLNNLEAALQLIDEVNEYRAGEGKSALLVTDTMMAMAEADADAYYDLKTAPKQFSVNGNQIAENLGTFASPKAAAEKWYSEKTVADEHPDYMSYSSPNWSQVGHYFNMSQTRFTVTGAGVNTRLGNKFAQTYFATANGETAYTTAQYRERIQAYKTALDDKKKAVEDAQTALNDAKTRQATAQAAVNAEQQANANQ